MTKISLFKFRGYNNKRNLIVAALSLSLSLFANCFLRPQRLQFAQSAALSLTTVVDFIGKPLI